MEKYDDISQNSMSRVKKNESIYTSTDMNELSRIKTNTNVSVISDASGKEIDLEKIKKYIYSMNDDKEDKRVSLELPEEEIKVVERKETREYDINTVLEKARGNRETDYENNRHRKFDNTECDILKTLIIKEETRIIEEDKDITGPIDELNTEEKTIVDLIKNMANNPKKGDLLDDLMPDGEDTVVMGQLEDKETITESLETIKEELINMTQDIEAIKEPINDLTRELYLEKEKLKNEESEDDENDIPAISKIDKSFYTNSLTFNKTDFEGFEELEKNEKKSNILSKIAIAFLVILLLITIFLIINSVFDLNII